MLHFRFCIYNLVHWPCAHVTVHWFCLATRWPFLCHGFQFWDPRRCPKSHILSVMANSLDTFSYIVTSLPSKPHRRACGPLLCLFNENLVTVGVGRISASDTNSRPPNCLSPFLSMLNHGTLSMRVLYIFDPAPTVRKPLVLSSLLFCLPPIDHLEMLFCFKIQVHFFVLVGVCSYSYIVLLPQRPSAVREVEPFIPRVESCSRTSDGQNYLQACPAALFITMLAPTLANQSLLQRAQLFSRQRSLAILEQCIM